MHTLEVHTIMFYSSVFSECYDFSTKDLFHHPKGNTMKQHGGWLPTAPEMGFKLKVQVRSKSLRGNVFFTWCLPQEILILILFLFKLSILFFFEMLQFLPEHLFQTLKKHHLLPWGNLKLTNFFDFCCFCFVCDHSKNNFLDIQGRPLR